MRPCSTKPLGETLYRLNRIGRKYAHQSTGITTRTDRVLIYYNYRIESKEPKKLEEERQVLEQTAGEAD